MQSKITFTLLFLFSFVIVHDTVFALIQSDEHVTTVSTISDVKETNKLQQCNINEVHSILHFVALLSIGATPLLTSQKKRYLSFYLLETTLFYEETSYKPPIA